MVGINLAGVCGYGFEAEQSGNAGFFTECASVVKAGISAREGKVAICYLTTYGDG
jgi:hypothetical protein